MLNSHQVKYLLIGGYAVSYHGYPRTTADMDIWIAIQKENAEKLMAVFREFGFDTPELAADLFLRQNQIIRMGNPPMRIELLTTISGVRFEECYSDRTIDVIDDVEVQIIGLEHLKLNKQASGRQKDLDDLEHL
ncbi:MAG: nucleotidyltransferase [Candidatus Poribacteria bacterium]|nr:nucleotidyltransferase [Candidatus Poribacteria bacterium]